MKSLYSSLKIIHMLIDDKSWLIDGPFLISVYYLFIYDMRCTVMLIYIVSLVYRYKYNSIFLFVSTVRTAANMWSTTAATVVKPIATVTFSQTVCSVHKYTYNRYYNSHIPDVLSRFRYKFEVFIHLYKQYRFIYRDSSLGI